MLAGPVLVLVYGITGWVLGWRLGSDSAVYRDGALLLLQGRPLYAAGTLGWGHHLWFTYPPVAAALFTPLTLVPAQVAWGVLGAASMLALTLVIWLAGRHAGERRLPAWAAAGLAVLAAVLLPVSVTVALGQVNLILMGLVAADALLVTGRRPRWGGMLTGLAAAVKLTPLVFIPCLLLTGRRAAAARALTVFAGLQAAGFAVLPGDSARFWTNAIFDTGHVGPASIPHNQTLNGLLQRVTSHAWWALPVALAVTAALAVPAGLLVLELHRRGRDLPALLVTAFYGLLVSPISWREHWVWVVPFLVLLVLRPAHADPGRVRALWRWRLAAAVAVAAVFAYGSPAVPQPDRIGTYGLFWWFVLGNAYVLTALGAGLVLAVTTWRVSPGRPGQSSPGQPCCSGSPEPPPIAPCMRPGR